MGTISFSRAGDRAFFDWSFSEETPYFTFTLTSSNDARITGADDRSGQTEYLENFILEARVDARSHLVGSIVFSDRNRIIHGCETWKFDMMTPVF